MAQGENHIAKVEFDAADINRKAKVERSLTAPRVSSNVPNLHAADTKGVLQGKEGGLVCCNNENRGSALQRDKNLLAATQKREKREMPRGRPD